MISVEEARARAAKRLISRRATWAADFLRPDTPPAAWRVALHPPTEREVRADERAAEQWSVAWREADRAYSDVHVEWTERAWRSIGRQRIPSAVAFSSADALVSFVGGSEARLWRVLRSRAEALAARFGKSEDLARAFQKHSATFLGLTEGGFEQVCEVVVWMGANETTGLRPRQLPIRGVDSKWFGAHRAVVTDVCAALGFADLGLVDSDPLVRIRVLDASLAPGGVREFAAPRAQLAALDLQPRFVFVFENLESVLALPDWPGAIAVHGSGYAVDALGSIEWIRDRPVLYWGDLDSHGFAILHRLRSHHDRVTSVLMDDATLLAHRDLWVAEPSPSRGSFPSLTAAEASVLERLRSEGDMRLEQERIPWGTALAALARAAPG